MTKIEQNINNLLTWTATFMFNIIYKAYFGNAHKQFLHKQCTVHKNEGYLTDMEIYIFSKMLLNSLQFEDIWTCDLRLHILHPWLPLLRHFLLDIFCFTVYYKDWMTAGDYFVASFKGQTLSKEETFSIVTY